MIVAMSRRHAIVSKQIRNCVLPERMYCQLEKKGGRELVFANDVDVHFLLVGDIGLLGRKDI